MGLSNMCCEEVLGGCCCFFGKLCKEEFFPGKVVQYFVISFLLVWELSELTHPTCLRNGEVLAF